MPWLKISRASTSSCGRAGLDEKVKLGSVAGPVTAMNTVVLPEVDSATRSSVGIRPPEKVRRPRFEVEALSQDGEASTPKIETADDAGGGGRTGDANRTTEFEVEAAAPHEDPAGRIEGEVEIDSAAARTLAAVGIELPLLLVDCRPRIAMGDVDASERARQLLRHENVDLGGVDGAAECRRAGERTGECDIGGKLCPDQFAVIVAAVVELHADVGRKSRCSGRRCPRPAAFRRRRAARRSSGCGPAGRTARSSR